LTVLSQPDKKHRVGERTESDNTPEAVGVAVRRLLERGLAQYPQIASPGDFLQRIERFAVELARWGAKLNLTAAPNDPARVAFHILDSLAPLLVPITAPVGSATELFAARQHVLDLGSGAGFPGLILAAATAADFVLTESRRKRASFLGVAAASMGLANVRVDDRYRIAFSPEFDIVTARAFARPAEFYELSRSAVKPGGIRILYASPRQRDDVERILNATGESWNAYEYEVPSTRSDSAPRAVMTRLLIVSRVKS
jgi:16S rRNA (guanine527-N7)-methyltransferase